MEGHRCFTNFIANMISALIAYNFLPKKPSLNLEIVDIQNVNNLKRIAYIELRLIRNLKCKNSDIFRYFTIFSFSLV